MKENYNKIDQIIKKQKLLKIKLQKLMIIKNNLFKMKNLKKVKQIIKTNNKKVNKD